MFEKDKNFWSRKIKVFSCKTENHIKTLDKETKVIYAKDEFDEVGLKSGRRKNYPILEELIKNILSNAKMLKF